MEKNFTLTHETSALLESIVAMDLAYNKVFLAIDDILEKGIDATSDAIKPFSDKFNEAKSEIYKLLQERIQTQIYEADFQEKTIAI